MTRKSIRKPFLIAAALVVLALFAAGCSPSAAGLTKSGNEAFAKQAYDEALKSYLEAQSTMPELAEPHYNAANALYREGKYAEAAQELQKAVQLAKDESLAQQSHYNEGNASYSEKQWDAAIESYKQALLKNPADADAKHNLELAMQQKQKQDHQKQDQQQQDQQNQDQQQQDQQKQDQQNQDQQNQDQQKQDQQNQDQQKQDQQNQDQQNQDQQKQNQGQPDPKQHDPKQPPQGAQLAPGQRMTQDQAKQLLAAIARKSDNLQHRLGEYLAVPYGAPLQDW